MIKTLTYEQKAAYLAAFIDGEGHIGCRKRVSNDRFFYRTICFVNTDKELFDNVVQICIDLGFTVRTYFDKSENEKWSDKWICYIRSNRKNFELFNRIIPLLAPRKKEAALLLLSSYVSPEESAQKRRTGKVAKCETCGKEFYVCKANGNRGYGKFCSIECRGLSQRKRVSKICQTCGNSYDVIEVNAPKSKFCSKKCIVKSPEEIERLRSQASKAAKARWKRGE